jgi:hypothetical protein
MSRRFYLPSQSATHNAAERRQRRVYNLLLGLVVLQFLTMGLLVTRTGGVKEGTHGSPSVEQTVSHVQSLVKPTLKDAKPNGASDSVSETQVTQATVPKAFDSNIPTRVQILNGCGIRGCTKTIAPVLREHGFDVREIGNADNFRYENTLILDRKGELARALALADSFGINHAYVSTERDEKLVDVDVTLIIGKNYGTLKFRTE